MLTLAEAAVRLGVEHDTLRRQIRLGKLRARKIGPIWTVTEREVERYRKESRRSDLEVAIRVARKAARSR